MREKEYGRPVMVSPAPGFTARVMFRIQERERVRARRRALIGAGLLAIAAGVLLLFVAGLLVSAVAIAVTNPDLFVTTLLAFAPLVDFLTALGEATWTAVVVIAGNISVAQMLVYALGVLALSLVWVRVVTGSPLRLLTRSWEV